MKTKLTLIVSALMLINTITYSQDYSEVIKLVASDRAPDDWFGKSVSISGNYAIIGANFEDEDASGGNTMDRAGSAYIFERDDMGNWYLVQKIVASDRAADDQFGRSVSIDGNYAIVGARFEDEDAMGGNTIYNAGSVYIFEYDGNGTWVEKQKIVASDRAQSDNFGKSVTISGHLLIVGAFAEDEDASGGNTVDAAGSAYIFERDEYGSWNQVQKIVASDRAADDFFGYVVSISGNYAIIGAEEEDEDASGGNTMLCSGSAYIFERNGSGIWNEVQKIVAADRTAGDYFGSSVSISGNFIIVGADSESEDASGGNTIEGAGSAYIFERDGDGNWNQVQKLVASDRDIWDQFGYSVSISGNKAVIGALNEDEDASGGNTLPESGSAYIFERNASGDWNEIQKIVASDRAALDFFGRPVCISGNYIIIGVCAEDEDASGGNTLTEAGSAYIFEACEADFSSDPDNFIENPNFETCILYPWELYYAWHLNTLATYQLIDGTCMVIPSHLTSSPEMWHIQLMQSLSAAQTDMLEQGETYTLTFDAWSEVDNMDCHVFFGQDEDPWTSLLYQMIALNTTPSTYSFDFTMSSVYPIMRLAFDIGTETTWAAFDNVSLVKKGPSISPELSEKTNIKLFPNPATNNLDIFTEAGSNIRIYNCSGILIQEFVANNHRTTYETFGLDKGVYFITISKDDQIITEKIIIQ